MNIIGVIVIVLNGHIAAYQSTGDMYPDVDTCRAAIHATIEKMGPPPAGYQPAALCIDLSDDLARAPAPAPEQKQEEFKGAPEEGNPDWRPTYNPRVKI